ncbi:hypothetical protein EMGBS15_07570 [Filimonas sp.]|nr:hypothetical protein EMGBS15_07570 [Filimonas sp.]
MYQRHDCNIGQTSLVAIASVSLTQPGCSELRRDRRRGRRRHFAFSVFTEWGSLWHIKSFLSLTSGNYYWSQSRTEMVVPLTSSAVLSSPSSLFFYKCFCHQPNMYCPRKYFCQGTGGLAPYLFALGAGSYSTAAVFYTFGGR